MDLNSAASHLKAAQGNPGLLALATVDIVLAGQAPAMMGALEAAAVPHWFDQSMLEALLMDDAPTADGWFDQLVQLSVIEPFQAHSAWNVHEVTRLALRKRLISERPDAFREISARAAEFVRGDTPALAVEHLYHRLSVAPDEGADELRRLWKQWSVIERVQPLQALGKALDEILAQSTLTPRARGYALVALGNIRDERMELGAWTALAEEAVELISQTGDDIGLVDAYSLLGRAQRARGRLADAISSYDKAKAIVERQPAHSPDDELTSERASLNLGAGRVMQDRGQSRDALQELTAGLDIRIRRLDAAPDDDFRRYELAVIHVDVGDVLSLLGDTPAAEMHFSETLSLFEQISPNLFERNCLQQNIARLRRRMAGLLLDRGDVDGAMKGLEEARQTFQELADQDPENFFHRSDLAQQNISVALVHFTREQLEAGESRLSAANAIIEDLVQRDPQNPAWKDQLGTIRSYFADLRGEQHRFMDALHDHQESERLCREVTEATPDRADSKVNLAMVQRKHALFMTLVAGAVDDEELRYNLLSQALVKLAGSHKIFNEVIEQDPANLTYRKEFAASQRALASVAESLSQLRGAELLTEVSAQTGISQEGMSEIAQKGYEASAALLIKLLEEDPQSTNYRREFSLTLGKWGGFLERLGKPAEALGVYRAALSEVRQLHTLDETNALWSGDPKFLQEVIDRLEGPGSPS